VKTREQIAEEFAKKLFLTQPNFKPAVFITEAQKRIEENF
jgi:hypothetical protein